MNRGALARKIGGYWLVAQMVRAHGFHPYYRPRFMKTSEALARQYSGVEDKYLLEQVPELLTKDPAFLSEDERRFLRAQFTDMVNMPHNLVRSWIRDPRLADGVGKQRFERLKAKLHLLEIEKIQRKNPTSGTSWSNRDYRSAQRSVFVIKNLFNPNYVDYSLWVTMRNYGRSWERPFGMRRMRSLPAKVSMDADLALLAHQIAGEGQPSIQS